MKLFCSRCISGRYVNGDVCDVCGTCAAGEYMVTPCDFRNNTICAPCYQEGCGPCQIGWQLVNGICRPRHCLIHGCGAANIGVVCEEVDDTHFTCRCPGETRQTITVLDPFQGFDGCDDNGVAPTAEEILAQVEFINIEANLVNNVVQILAAVVIDIDGDTITLDITATTPIENIQPQIRQQLAEFLGGDYEPEDIILTIKSSSPQQLVNQGTVLARVRDRAFVADTNTAGHVIFSWFGVLALLLLPFFF